MFLTANIHKFDAVKVHQLDAAGAAANEIASEIGAAAITNDRE